MNEELMKELEKIVAESPAHFWNPEDTTLTCCVLALPSGFTVLGKSACSDKSQFTPDMGRRLAFEDACNELAKLEAYKQATSPRIQIARPHEVPGIVTN